MSRFDSTTVESRLARIENELELARVRDGRNIRHILKVMTRQHAEVMAVLNPPKAGEKKVMLAFGQPADKPFPAEGGHPAPASQPGKVAQPKEKLR